MSATSQLNHLINEKINAKIAHEEEMQAIQKKELEAYYERMKYIKDAFADLYENKFGIVQAGSHCFPPLHPESSFAIGWHDDNTNKIYCYFVSEYSEYGKAYRVEEIVLKDNYLISTNKFNTQEEVLAFILDSIASIIAR